MKKINIFGIVALFILVFSFSTVCIVSTTATDDGKPYTILDTTLKTGKYYQDGDITKPYVEVFSDKTLKWCGVDFENHVRSMQKARNADTAEFEKAIQEESDRLSSVHEYTIVDFKNINTTLIAWDWIEESGAAQGFIYIDENTFKFTDDEIFIYVE